MKNTMRYLALAALLFILPSAAQTTTPTKTPVPTPEPTVDPEFMDNLRNGLKEMLDSIYPSIAAFKTITLPTALEIDGSMYTIPQIVMQTPTSASASTTASSTPTSPPSGTSSALKGAAEATSTPAPKHGISSDRRLAIVLGVVLGFIALALLLLILCLAHRRKRRTGYYLKHERPPSDAEVATWRSSGNGSWMGRNHMTKIWSTREKGLASEKSYGPIEHSAPHMATLSTGAGAGAGAGFLAGALAGRHGRQHSNDTSRSRNGYHTPPQESAVNGVAADGPYARASNADSLPLRHSYHGEPAIGSVPNPYEVTRPASIAGSRHGAIVNGSDPSQTSSEESVAAKRNRPPTPLLHTMFGLAAGARSRKNKDVEAPVDDGPFTDRAATGADPVSPETSQLSNRGSIVRKPVPTAINTASITSSSANANRGSDPFTSPADNYHNEVGTGSPYARETFADQRGDDYGTVPVPPVRSPERRHSPQVHYPSGAEVGQFDFGLSREQLRELREAGENGQRAPVRRQWSFE